MFDQLTKNMRSYVSFSQDELMYFISLLEFRSLKRFEKVLKIGDVCNEVFFINRGLLRYFSENNEKEYTLRVFKEAEWAANYVSFLTRKPSHICIEALEDCDLFILKYDDLQTAYDNAKVFERLGRKMMESIFIEVVERTTDVLTKSTEIRYMELVEKDPQLFNRIPLKYIASMLGIEPESLSRLRRKMNITDN